MYLVVKNKKYLTISDEKGYGFTSSISKAFQFDCLSMAQDKAKEVKGVAITDFSILEEMMIDGLLLDNGMTGIEVLAHSITGDLQTARLWAEEFITNNPSNANDTLWNWNDFSTLVKLT